MRDPRLFAYFRALICGAILPLVGCVQTSDTYLRSAVSVPGATPPRVTQADTINLESTDRIARFRRLAAQLGTAAPRVDELTAPAGTVEGVAAPVPVVRLVFEERSLFDVDRDVPRPEALPIIRLIAENMRRDVPDAAVTILGHTDATGSDAHNEALSRRRAAAIMRDLIGAGVDPAQMSTVAIGKYQPIYANSSELGRARNRRVEFLISGSEQANLSVVSRRAVDRALLEVGGAPVAAGERTVRVLKPKRTGGAVPASAVDDDDLLGPAGLIQIRVGADQKT